MEQLTLAVQHSCLAHCDDHYYNAMIWPVKVGMCLTSTRQVGHGQVGLSWLEVVTNNCTTLLSRVTGMLLMWTFAEVSERPYWKAMSWAMVCLLRRTAARAPVCLGTAVSQPVISTKLCNGTPHQSRARNSPSNVTVRQTLQSANGNIQQLQKHCCVLFHLHYHNTLRPCQSD